jgi:hypothetical protein
VPNKEMRFAFFLVVMCLKMPGSWKVGFYWRMLLFWCHARPTQWTSLVEMMTRWLMYSSNALLPTGKACPRLCERQAVMSVYSNRTKA